MDDILIIGAGSIGALMGAALAQAGANVTLAGKPNSNYTQLLQRQGMQLYFADGKSLWISAFHPQVRFVDTATDLQQKFSIIIIALKSNHLKQVVSYIQTHANPRTILIHAQNGIPYWWFNCDRYLASLDRNIVGRLNRDRCLDSVDPGGFINKNLAHFTSVGCVVKAPCQKTLDGKITVKKPPKLTLGFTQKNHSYQQLKIIQQLQNFFSRHGIEAHYSDRIRTVVCNKLAINLTTNVLSALTGKLVAELTTNSAINTLIETIIAEVDRVFSCYGIPAQDLPTPAKVYSYITTPGSQKHLPSLAQDFSLHKSGEISLITAVVEMAKIAQLKTPTLNSLSELLQLAQTYSLNCEEKSHILTWDNSGYCNLTKDVCESSVVDKYQISDLLSHLVRVNMSALAPLRSL